MSASSAVLIDCSISSQAQCGSLLNCKLIYVQLLQIFFNVNPDVSVLVPVCVSIK